MVLHLSFLMRSRKFWSCADFCGLRMVGEQGRLSVAAVTAQRSLLHRCVYSHEAVGALSVVMTKTLTCRITEAALSSSTCGSSNARELRFLQKIQAQLVTCILKVLLVHVEEFSGLVFFF